MLVSRILSRVSRSAGLRSSLSAATLQTRNRTPIFSSWYHSLVHDYSHKLVPAQVSMDSFALQRFSFSSSTSPESDEKKSNPEASNTSEDKAAAEANESGTDAEPKHSVTDSAEGNRTSAKRDASSGSDSQSDDDELSADDLVKLVAQKEFLLSRKEKEIQQLNDKVLRIYAELENVTERKTREAENSRKYAIQDFAKSLLDVADNLGRASSVVKESFSKLHTSKEDPAGAAPLLKTLLEGVEMTEKQLAVVFKRFGMEKYDPTNEPFDPNRHNAVFQVPDPYKPEGTVAHVLKYGYTLHDRVLRPADVGVTQRVENEEEKGCV